MVELFGNDLLKVRTLVAAAGYTGMEGAVYEMLRSIARQKDFNLDDLPTVCISLSSSLPYFPSRKG